MKSIRWHRSGDNIELQYSDDGRMRQSYRSHPLYQPDYPIESGSKGYRTMQILMKSGYIYADI